MKRYWLSISLATAACIVLLIFVYNVFYIPYLDTVSSDQPVNGVSPYPLQDQTLQAPQEPATGDEYADVPGAIIPDQHVVRIKRTVVREDLEDDRYLTTQLSVRPADNGIVVLTLEKGSLLMEAGLRVGDRIQNVNGSPVRSIKDLSKAIKEAQARCNGPVSLERVTSDGRLDPIYIKPK